MTTKYLLFVCTCFLVNVSSHVELKHPPHECKRPLREEDFPLPLPKCKAQAATYDTECQKCADNLKSPDDCDVLKCTNDVDEYHRKHYTSFKNCTYTRKEGWTSFEKNEYLSTNYTETDSEPPELIAVNWYKRPYCSQDLKAYAGNPSLSLSFRIPCMLKSHQKTGAPKLMLMKFGSYNDSEFKDEYYSKNTIYRLFNFSSFSPSTYDCEYRKYVISFNCLTGLDACSKSMSEYFVHVKTFSDDVHLESTWQEYTITTFNNHAHQLKNQFKPAIAMGVRDRKMTVVFQPHPDFENNDSVVYEVTLWNVEDCKVEGTVKIKRSPEYIVSFDDIKYGYYKAKIVLKTIQGNRETLIDEFVSAEFVFGKLDRSDKMLMSTEDSTDIKVVAIVGGCVFGITLVICIMVIYRMKNSKPGKKSTVFILYSNKDLHVAKVIKNCLSKFENVEVAFDVDDCDFYKDPSSVHTKLMSKASHIMVFWSPGCTKARSQNHPSPVKDMFKDSLEFLITSNCLKKTFLVYIPEYEDVVSLDAYEPRLKCVTMFKCLGAEDLKKVHKHLTGSTLNNSSEIDFDSIITATCNDDYKEPDEEANHTVPVESFLPLTKEDIHVNPSCPIHGCGNHKEPHSTTPPVVKEPNPTRPSVVRDKSLETCHNFPQDTQPLITVVNEKSLPFNSKQSSAFTSNSSGYYSGHSSCRHHQPNLIKPGVGDGTPEELMLMLNVEDCRNRGQNNLHCSPQKLVADRHQEFQPGSVVHQGFQPEAVRHQGFQPRTDFHHEFQPGSVNHQEFQPNTVNHQVYHPRADIHQEFQPETDIRHEFLPRSVNHQEFQQRTLNNREYHPEADIHQEFQRRTLNNREYHPEADIHQEFQPRTLNNQEYHTEADIHLEFQPEYHQTFQPRAVSHQHGENMEELHTNSGNLPFEDEMMALNFDL